jgi:ribosomal protein L40E
MAQVYPTTPFDSVKMKVADSSKRISNYLSWLVIIGFVLGIMFSVLIIGFLVPTIGFSLATLSIYALIGAMFAPEILAIALVFVLIMIIPILILLALAIQVIINTFKLGSGFHKLSTIDSSSINARYVSYAIYGYIISSIIAAFVPRYGGVALMLVGNLSLAVGAFFIYKLFSEYQKSNRYPQSPTITLLIAVSINLVASIINFFTIFGFFGSILGFIFLLFGLKTLSKEIMYVLPLTTQIGLETSAPQEASYGTQQTESNLQADTKFCASCGAKQPIIAKFCQHCGSTF